MHLQVSEDWYLLGACAGLVSPLQPRDGGGECRYSLRHLLSVGTAVAALLVSQKDWVHLDSHQLTNCLPILKPKLEAFS